MLTSIRVGFHGAAAGFDGLQSGMARYDIPQNVGKVRVAIFLGNKYVVWNGKQGQHEFRIPCRDRRQAEEVATKINRREHDGQIEVLS